MLTLYISLLCTGQAEKQLTQVQYRQIATDISQKLGKKNEPKDWMIEEYFEEKPPSVELLTKLYFVVLRKDGSLIRFKFRKFNMERTRSRPSTKLSLTDEQWYKKAEGILAIAYPKLKLKRHDLLYRPVRANFHWSTSDSNTIAMEFRDTPKNGQFNSFIVDFAAENGALLNVNTFLKTAPISLWNMDLHTRAGLKKMKP